MSEDRAEYVHVNPEDLQRLRREMSEDPVKYEPMAGNVPNFEYQRGYNDATLEVPEDKQQIRIEALRLSVELAKVVNSDRRECVERTINTAKQFAAYLETGE